MQEAEQLVAQLKQNGLIITAMESCTGGAVLNAITSVEGASNVTQGGYITYSNNQKVRIGVSPDVIERYGVYSQECAKEMARAVRTDMDADIGIGVTGTLSNVDPRNPDSKPGEVHWAVVERDVVSVSRTITVPVMDRSLQKEYIVQAVLKDVLNLVEILAEIR